MRIEVKESKVRPNLILAPMPNAPTATVLAAFKVGSRHEPARWAGISHFLEHMMFKGTKKRPSVQIISHELDGLGAVYNAFTGNELTAYYIKAEADQLPRIFEVLADIIHNPQFPDLEAKKERGIILEELKMYLDDPKRNVLDLYGETIYTGNTLGRKIVGSRATVRSITRANLLQYYHSKYIPEIAHLIVSGGFKSRAIIEQFKRVYPARPKPRMAPAAYYVDRQRAPRVAWYHDDTEQTHLTFGFPTGGESSPDVLALDFWSNILGGAFGSKLFMNVREKLGLAYYIRSYYESFTETGTILAHAGVRTDKLPRALKAIWEEFNRAASIKISNAELKHWQENYIGRLAMDLESSDGLAMHLMEEAIYRGKRVRGFRELSREVRALTSGQLLAVAAKYFRKSKINLAVVGPRYPERESRRIIASLS